MPDIKEVTRTLHYKQAKFLSGEVSLQTHLEKALEKLKIKKKDGRAELLKDDPEDRFYRFINESKTGSLTWKSPKNETHTLPSMFFGVLRVYEQDAHHEAMEPLGTEAAKAPLAVAPVPPETEKDGKEREFVQSSLYFAVKDNHIVFLHSPGLNTRKLETHLNWLLHASKDIAEKNSISLTTLIPEETEKKIKSLGVKKLSIGTPLFHEIWDESGNEKKGPIFHRLNSTAQEVLKLIAPDFVKQKTLDEITEDRSKLEIFVEVRPRRGRINKDQKILDELSKALRHSDVDDIRVSLEGGHVIKNEELHTHFEIKAEVDDGKILNHSLLWKKMAECLYNNFLT